MWNPNKISCLNTFGMNETNALVEFSDYFHNISILLFDSQNVYPFKVWFWCVLCKYGCKCAVWTQKVNNIRFDVHNRLNMQTDRYSTIYAHLRKSA